MSAHQSQFDTQPSPAAPLHMPSYRRPHQHWHWHWQHQQQQHQQHQQHLGFPQQQTATTQPELPQPPFFPPPTLQSQFFGHSLGLEQQLQPHPPFFTNHHPSSDFRQSGTNFSTHLVNPLINSFPQGHGPASQHNPPPPLAFSPVSFPLRDRCTLGPSLGPSFFGPGGGTNPQRRLSMGGSDAGSPSGRRPSDLLEEDLSDDLDLAPRGSRAPALDRPRNGRKTGDPPWTNMRTKAGKERKRLPLACIACRKKKVRCSGEEQGCEQCLRSRTPCAFIPNPKAAPARTEYMHMLDKRLKRMEDRIIKITPTNDGMKSPMSVARASVKKALPVKETPAPAKGPRKRGAAEAFGHEPARPALELWAPRPPAAQLAHVKESADQEFMNEGLAALPPEDIQEHLAGIFFEHVYGQAYHILHQPTYLRRLRNRTLPPALILSVCAISARFSQHPRVLALALDQPNFARGDHWAEVARGIVTKRYDKPSLTVLICLLLLGLHEFGTCHGSRSWALGGQATRMAIDLQLHKDLKVDPQNPEGGPLSFLDREIRRRTMWACFMMDRFNSSGSDRPTSIKAEDLKIPLPVNEHNYQHHIPACTENLQGEVPGAASLGEDGQMDAKENAKENMGVAAYMIKAIDLWSRAVLYLSQGGKDSDVRPVWEDDSEYAKLVNEAEAMEASLPDRLQYTKDNLLQHNTDKTVSQFVFLHIAVQQNILFLNRLAVAPDPNFPQDVPMNFVTRAGSRAFGAANRISELLKDADPYLERINAPFLGYCAFLASTVHIFGHFSGPRIEKTSTPHLKTNIRFLNKLKRGWALFNFILNTMQQQFCELARRQRGGGSNGGVSDMASTKIFQYGDWFNMFPNGLSEGSAAYIMRKQQGEDAVLEQKRELQTVEEMFLSLDLPQAHEGAGPDNSMVLQRKRSLATRDPQSQQQLQPLMTEAAPEQSAGLQHQQQANRYASAAPGGQTSGGAAFGGVSAVHHPSLYGSNIPPVTVGHDPFANHQNGMYNDDPFGMQLPPQQQSLIQTHPMPCGQFGVSQGLDTAAAVSAALMTSLPWGNIGSGPRDSSRSGGGGGNGAQPPNSGGPGPDASHGNRHHTVYGHGQDLPNQWLVGFEPNTPDVGDVVDMGSIDELEFANFFANANAGGAPGGQ